YRPREITTDVLLAAQISGTEMNFRQTQARSELVRRFTDWLYPAAYLGIGAIMLIISRGKRFAYRWLLPMTLVVGVPVKAVGLAMIGSAATQDWAIVAAFVAPLLATISPLIFSFFNSLFLRLRLA
ncbi:MAG: hypothetical protein AAGO57_04555, partial [Pseudomonadota bacterium]